MTSLRRVRASFYMRPLLSKSVVLSARVNFCVKWSFSGRREYPRRRRRRQPQQPVQSKETNRRRPAVVRVSRGRCGE